MKSEEEIDVAGCGAIKHPGEIDVAGQKRWNVFNPLNGSDCDPTTPILTRSRANSLPMLMSSPLDSIVTAQVKDLPTDKTR